MTKSAYYRENYYRNSSIVQLKGKSNNPPPLLKPSIESSEEKEFFLQNNSDVSLCSAISIDPNQPLRQSELDRRDELPMGTKRMLRKFVKSGSEALQSISREDIRLIYTFEARLGSGSFGSVRIAHKTRSGENSIKFAVKSIPRS